MDRHYGDSPSPGEIFQWMLETNGRKLGKNTRAEVIEWLRQFGLTFDK